MQLIVNVGVLHLSPLYLKGEISVVVLNLKALDLYAIVAFYTINECPSLRPPVSIALPFCCSVAMLRLSVS